MKKVCREREEDALRRTNHASDTIIKLAEKMENRWKETAAPRSYAQVARMGGANAARGITLDAPPAAPAREEKRIVARLGNK
jgi:hypothetical protein